MSRFIDSNLATVSAGRGWSSPFRSVGRPAASARRQSLRPRGMGAARALTPLLLLAGWSVFASVPAVAQDAPAAVASGSESTPAGETAPDAAPVPLVGVVRSPSGPVATATVEVVGRDGALAATAHSGPDGTFRLELPGPGRWQVQASALGYDASTEEVDAEAVGPARVEILLQPSAFLMDPLVVTGTLREVRVSDSPVKVDVVSGRVLQRFSNQSLMDAVGRVNGLQQQVDCGVCYTNNIRINGMEGPYTAVLIDGMPIMGALASVYGLNGIHPSMVERLEILKGPQSTLYGTEAMGGVVNVITKDARFAPRMVVDANRSDFGETSMSLAWAPGSGRSGTMLGGQFVRNQQFVDNNADGFSDLTLDTRLNLFGKTGLVRNGRRIGTFTAKVYLEDRFGGPENWTEADRGSSTLYGESIRTGRAELLGRVELPWAGTRFEGSWSYHNQNAYYGDALYDATQQIGFGQVVWDPERGESRHDLLAGFTGRYVFYDDQTPATTSPERRFIPGVFVEDQVAVRDWLTLLGGVRADHHEAHGIVTSPRASVMVKPNPLTTFRLSGGTGFRVVNLFTEDHAALSGARQVVIQESLQPERSRSLAFNANRILPLGGNPLMLDLDVFYTRFQNRIIPDYDQDPNLIVYRNLNGRESVSRGVSLALNQNFGDRFPLFYTLGVTLQDVFIEEPGGGRVDELFAPDFRGVWSASYSVGRPGRGVGGLVFDYAGSVTGSMRLPEYEAPFQRRTRSPVFVTHDVQLTWQWRPGQELILSVRNLGDFTQGSPLVDAANPFGEAFDTAYFWGPVLGRRISLGFRWQAPR